MGAGCGRSSVSGGSSRSLTPAVATLARGCFLHPGIFWSLHPGSSKVPGPKTGSKCDGTFRSQPPPGPLRPVEPVRPPCCPPAPAGRRQLPAPGHRGRGGSRALVTLKLPSPHAQAGASLSGPGLWRRLRLQRRVTSSRRGTAATRQGRKMAAASEELNGAGTPGGGVGWGGPGAAEGIGPGLRRVGKPSCICGARLPVFFFFFLLLLWLVPLVCRSRRLNEEVGLAPPP